MNKNMKRILEKVDATNRKCEKVMAMREKQFARDRKLRICHACGKPCDPDKLGSFYCAEHLPGVEKFRRGFGEMVKNDRVERAADFEKFITDHRAQIVLLKERQKEFLRQGGFLNDEWEKNIDELEKKIVDYKKEIEILRPDKNKRYAATRCEPTPCAFPGCNESLPPGHYNTRYCDKHKNTASRVAAKRERDAIKAAKIARFGVNTPACNR